MQPHRNCTHSVWWLSLFFFFFWYSAIASPQNQNKKQQPEKHLNRMWKKKLKFKWDGDWDHSCFRLKRNVVAGYRPSWQRPICSAFTVIVFNGICWRIYSVWHFVVYILQVFRFVHILNRFIWSFYWCRRIEPLCFIFVRCGCRRRKGKRREHQTAAQHYLAIAHSPVFNFQ